MKVQVMCCLFWFCGPIFNEKIYQFIYFWIDWLNLETLTFSVVRTMWKTFGYFQFFVQKLNSFVGTFHIYIRIMSSITNVGWCQEPVDTKHHISDNKRVFDFKNKLTIHVCFITSVYSVPELLILEYVC